MVRRRKNLGGILEDFAAQPAIKNAFVIVVVIKDECGSANKEEKKDRKKDFEERRSKEIRYFPCTSSLRLTFSHMRSIAPLTLTTFEHLLQRAEHIFILAAEFRRFDARQVYPDIRNSPSDR